MANITQNYTNNNNNYNQHMHESAMNTLNNGEKSLLMTNMQAHQPELFKGSSIGGFSDTVPVYFFSYEVASNASFAPLHEQEPAKANISYPEPILVIGSSSFAENKLIDNLFKGRTFDEFTVRVLFRGGDENDPEKKMKTSIEYKFKKIRITFFLQNPVTGLIYFRFEYRELKIDKKRYDAKGDHKGHDIVEINTQSSLSTVEIL